MTEKESVSASVAVPVMVGRALLVIWLLTMGADGGVRSTTKLFEAEAPPAVTVSRTVPSASPALGKVVVPERTVAVARLSV